MEYSELVSETGRLLLKLEKSNKEKNAAQVQEILELYKGYVAGVHFGAHEGEISKFAEKCADDLDRIGKNVKKGSLKKEDADRIFLMCRNLFSVYVPDGYLSNFRGLLKKAGSLGKFRESLTKEDAIHVLAELKETLEKNKEELKLVFTSCTKKEQNAISNFLNYISRIRLPAASLALMASPAAASGISEFIESNKNLLSGMPFVITGLYLLIRIQARLAAGTMSEENAKALRILSLAIFAYGTLKSLGVIDWILSQLTASS